jgi:hypothetical protein
MTVPQCICPSIHWSQMLDAISIGSRSSGESLRTSLHLPVFLRRTSYRWSVTFFTYKRINIPQLASNPTPPTHAIPTSRLFILGRTFRGGPLCHLVQDIATQAAVATWTKETPLGRQYIRHACSSSVGGLDGMEQKIQSLICILPIPCC